MRPNQLRAILIFLITPTSKRLFSGYAFQPLSREERVEPFKRILLGCHNPKSLQATLSLNNTLPDEKLPRIIWFEIGRRDLERNSRSPGLLDKRGTDIERKRWSSWWHVLRPRLKPKVFARWRKTYTQQKCTFLPSSHRKSQGRHLVQKPKTWRQ